MNKVTLYYCDTRKHTYSDLLSRIDLNVEQRKSLERFRVLETKKERLISIYFKKKYVGDFTLNEHGKPVSDSVFFNISHSRGVVALAICEQCKIGLDIEVIKPKDNDLVKYVCNDEEYRHVKNEFDFLSIWTNKESLVKCLGTGIKKDIKSIPSLPLDGQKEYQNNLFFSKITKINDYIVSITIMSGSDFNLQIVEESI